MKLEKAINESKFSVGQKAKMIPEDGIRPVSIEIIQVLRGRCKVLFLDGKNKGEEMLVWNSKIIS
jgi:hypothetical protein